MKQLITGGAIASMSCGDIIILQTLVASILIFRYDSLICMFNAIKSTCLLVKSGKIPAFSSVESQ